MTCQPVIIMPCFNEEKNIYATCQSLGFGLNQFCFLESSPILIIVDNNSSDATSRLAHEIKLSSPGKSVYVIVENEQGYIPARRAGNEFAISLSSELHIKANEMLIFQVDADTIYPIYYIESMKTAAEMFGRNILLEACVDYSPEFRQKTPNFIHLLEYIDAKYEKLFRNYQDYIVDDKVAAYWLNDYILWGGYIQEFTPSGDEIFAETTRLFLKGLSKDAKRIRVDSIKAFHSERKVIENPSLHFATAGFPRENSWNNFWEKSVQKENIQNIDAINFKEAIFFRELHIIALFCLLPIHVDSVLSNNEQQTEDVVSKSLIKMLPKRTKNDLFSRPGVFISDVFTIIHEKRDFIKELIDEYLKSEI